MKRKCSYLVRDGWLICQNEGCDRRYKYRGKIYVSHCRCDDCPQPDATKPAHPGDRFETYLRDKWNFDEKRYKSFKKFLGLPPDCDCKKRKDWLNRVPAAFQDGYNNCKYFPLWCGVLAARKEIKAWKQDWAGDSSLPPPCIARCSPLD